MPNANLSYTIQPESYSLMNAMEFMTDEYFEAWYQSLCDALRQYEG